MRHIALRVRLRALPFAQDDTRVEQKKKHHKGAYNHAEGMYGIARLRAYGIRLKAGWNQSEGKYTLKRDAMPCDARIPYQSFGLDRKKQVFRLAFFLERYYRE